jgi:hypothetical protein
MYTVEAGKQVKIWVSVKINISFSRPFPKNQITYQQTLAGHYSAIASKRNAKKNRTIVMHPMLRGGFNDLRSVL